VKPPRALREGQGGRINSITIGERRKGLREKRGRGAEGTCTLCLRTIGKIFFWFRKCPNIYFIIVRLSDEGRIGWKGRRDVHFEKKKRN